MRSCTKAVLFVAAALPLLFANGCTNTDVISTGNTPFVVEVPITNPSNEFDRFATMQLSQIQILPNDPDALNSLPRVENTDNPRPIGVLGTAANLIQIDFRVAGSSDPSELVLGSGSYRISTLQFTNPFLVKTPLPSWTNCDDAPAFLLPNNAPTITFTSADLGALANFTVPQAGAGALTIGIDATAFIEAFTTTWTCTAPPNPRPVTFDRTAFKNLAPTYLTIRSTILN